jgi:hypothetical protein
VWERGFGVDSRKAPLFKTKKGNMICSRWRPRRAGNSTK